jgi:arabinofuranosyltransferase
MTTGALMQNLNPIPYLKIFCAATLPIALFLYISTAFSFGLVDDAYIPMNYAKHVMQGEGIVFYPGGERVEGYTSPLWLVYLLAGSVFPVSLPHIAYAGGLLFGAGVIIITMLLCWMVCRPVLESKKVTMAASFFAGLLVSVDFSFVGWSSSGMETSLYALLQLVLLFSLLSRWSMVATGLIFALLCLVRPEGVLFILPLLFIYKWQHQKWLSFFNVGMLLVPFVGLLLLRYGYFGYFFPNTFYAKHDFGGLALIIRGSVYVVTFLIPRLAFVFALYGLILKRTRLDTRSRAIVFFIGTNLLAVILEGGDHFAMHRFLVPVIPLMAILTALGLVYFIQRYLPAVTAPRPFLGSLLLCACVLSSAHNTMLWRFKMDDYFGFSKGVQWLINEAQWANGWKEIGLWLRDKYEPGTRIAVITAGAIPFYSDLPCIDILGLNDVTIAHAPSQNIDWRYPGHEKSHPGYVLKQKPKFIQLFPLLFFGSRPYPEWSMERMLTYTAQQDIWDYESFRSGYSFVLEKTDKGYLSYYERND